MNPATLQGLAEIVVPSLCVIVFGGFGLMCFPSIRGAFAERLRNRSLRHADATELAATLNALRGEVYALRGEIADVKRAIGPGTSAGAHPLPPGR